MEHRWKTIPAVNRSGGCCPLDKNINKIDNMWHFNATPALFKHVPRQPNLRLIYMLCFMYASGTGQYGTLHCHRQNTLCKSLHFFFLCLFLSFCPPILLLSFLPLFIFLSWFPYLWLYFPYISIPLLPSSVFLFSVFRIFQRTSQWSGYLSSFMHRVLISTVQYPD
jgi:hypothetical protein